MNKSEFPSAIGLGIAKLETESINIFGFSKDVTLIKILWKLCIISFICGYSDAHTYLNRGVFSTMMTGNVIILFVAAATNDLSLIAPSALVVTSYMLIGVPLNILIIQITKSWEKAYEYTLAVVLSSATSCVIMDTILGNKLTYYISLIIYGIAIGNLCFWTSKTGFLVMLHTGNMMKIVEFMYKYLLGYDLGDSKAQGDSITILLLFICFLLGAVFASFINSSISRGLLLLPIIIITAILLAYEQFCRLYDHWKRTNDNINKSQAESVEFGLSINKL